MRRKLLMSQLAAPSSTKRMPLKTPWHKDDDDENARISPSSSTDFSVGFDIRGT